MIGATVQPAAPGDPAANAPVAAASAASLAPRPRLHRRSGGGRPDPGQPDRERPVGRALAPGGHVWLEARASAEWITLLVSDDGPGFPPGTTERIFDRFYRGDPARSGSGSGLGLAIVRELARAHGGEALAESLAPRGARVIVHLPRTPRVAW